MSAQDTITVAELIEALGAFKPHLPVKIRLDDDGPEAAKLLHPDLPYATTASPVWSAGELVETWQGEAGGDLVIAFRPKVGE